MSGEWLQGDESSVMTPSEEEKCEELWERVEGVRHKLTRVLNPAKLTPYLRQCKVIDEQDEDEVLNSSQYPMRISRAGRLLDILRGRGERGLQAFMESLEFYHPEQFTQLTGQQPTQRCSIMLDEEGPEGLTQFLLLEVRKLREQLRGSRLCERRLSQRCRVAEEERSRAERKAQELRQDRIQLERLRHDKESCTRELGLLKDRHLEQAVKYSRALEEQRRASVREKELLTEVEQLRKRLLEVEKRADDGSSPSLMHHMSNEACDSASPGPMETQPLTVRKTEHNTGNQALLDILQQDRREAVEQRQELCSAIARLQGELESSEMQRERLASQCEQLQLRLRALQLDWETEQSRSVSYFTQIMELERERDQALRSRDALQLEFTDCLLDKNRLRKRMAELQNSLEQQQRETESHRGQREQSAPCLHCSHLSLFSEDQCFGPCCSGDLSPSPLILRAQKSTSQAQICELSEDSYCSNSEENLLTPECNTEKDINRLSTFPFPPCMNSIHRRANVEFDLNSWGSDENETPTEDLDSCLLSSWSSLPSQLFPLDVINVIEPSSSSSSPRLDPVLSSSPKSISLASDITIIGGNRTGVFVQTVRTGSPAERCGLKEGSELLELDQVLLGEGRVRLSQCTAEVAHFSLQWWTEPSALKHTHNQEGYSRLLAELSSPSFTGADSFYVRVNLDLSSHGDPPCLRARCDDVLHVTDTRYNGKYQWRCVCVDKHTGAPLQAGAVPNYNRAQQLLLVRLRTMAIEQNQCRKKFSKKTPEHIRLIKAVASNYRAIGSSNQVLYTLSNRHEEQLIPFSLVQMIRVSSKRPVVFCPSLLSRGIIERLLQPVESGLDFNTCHPEPLEGCVRQDKSVFLLDSSDQPLGIKLQSIQEVINQDKHCLLQLGLNHVEHLLKQSIYPIIIYIKPRDKKGRKFRKLLSGHREEDLMEVCQMEELQLETLPLMFSTLEPNMWSSTDELLAVIRSTILVQQRAVVWLEQERVL
ncbi:caspase recruitment domain-containing protein 11 isoform X1 [Pimephales promelas]|uniref:caspase recruitment domain-containing protein 11 isoform X1 n=1 Tax=Pimephales promelas TaxID=90988 RepID=UPI00195577C7|nr:caspase recruitment domain-containing protein 11 isoform X1 [Pimephales promelas]KAG1966976.1 caspase recruitment domain-containing protein [Pimephales promelas]